MHPHSQRYQLAYNPATIELMLDFCELQPSVKLDTAHSLSDGLSEASSCSYDIILLDIHLPDMSGTDALPLLKEITPYTPIVDRPT